MAKVFTLEEQHPEFFGVRRAITADYREPRGSRVPNMFIVFRVSSGGFLAYGQPQHLNDLTCDFYVRDCDLEELGKDEVLYAKPRRRQ